MPLAEHIADSRPLSTGDCEHVFIQKKYELADQFVVDAQRFLELYGWYIVFCALGLYLTQDYIRSGIKAHSLTRANDPKRRKVLDSDLKRVRLRQQRDASSHM